MNSINPLILSGALWISSLFPVLARRPILPDFHKGVWVDQRKGVCHASYPTRESQATQANGLVHRMATSPLGPWEFMGGIIHNKSPNVHDSITELKGQAYLFCDVAAAPDRRERQICLETLSPVMKTAQSN